MDADSKAELRVRSDARTTVDGKGKLNVAASGENGNGRQGRSAALMVRRNGKAVWGSGKADIRNSLYLDGLLKLWNPTDSLIARCSFA